VNTTDLRSLVRTILEARIRETDITDGTRVQFGSPEHVTDLEMRIADLERWRDRQRRGSEARANYARLISALRRELRSAYRVNEPKSLQPVEPELTETMDTSSWGNDKPKKAKTKKCAHCGEKYKAKPGDEDLDMCDSCGDSPAESMRMSESVDMEDPEFASVEDFVQFLLDDERDTYTHEELGALNFRTRMPIGAIRKELESYGLKLATREPEKQVRGFSSNSHDRWFGKGSLPTHGGAGIDASTGRATVRGRTV